MPAPRDFDKEINSAQSLAPATRNATANGTGVDLAGFEKAAVVLSAGTITDGTHTPKIQDSDDNSTLADVAASLQSGTFTALTSGAGGNANQEVGYLGAKRYLRVVVTVTGATTGGAYAANVIRAGARTLPQ
jgi:hypothetical protein